ncbi:uncharacterized protein LOC127751098 [Frankliniella occidentalis]|uniref:Uncharacterized protein LOC127751098 n=1 Tax=Frankliniella occidentalis TaxID=133901 RepID=A0A9C6X6M4_FRAOC|nr:uncharacterized protein LOC127751098 [Frankliniella occidentalis]
MPFMKKSAIIRNKRLVAMNVRNGIENRARKEAEEAKREEEEAAATAAAPDPEQSPACPDRRIANLPCLGESLWCDFCDDALSLRFQENEQRNGLASVFHVRCHRCMKVVKIHTDDKGPVLADGKSPLYSINLQAATGCIDAGVSHGQLNKLFSAMNLPPVHRTSFVRAQDRVKAHREQEQAPSQSQT